MASPRGSWPFGRRQTLRDQYHRRQISYEQYEALLRQRLLRRVEHDLRRGDTQRAISRLESGINPFNAELQRRLAALYLAADQPVKAGRCLYLVGPLTEEEQAAVAAFEASLGCCPLGISRKLAPQQFFSYQQLDWYARQRYANLISQIQARFGLVPHFLVGFKFQLDKYGPQPDNR